MDLTNFRRTYPKIFYIQFGMLTLKKGIANAGRGSSLHDKGVEIYVFASHQSNLSYNYMFNLKKIASINFINCQGHKQPHVVGWVNTMIVCLLVCNSGFDNVLNNIVLSAFHMQGCITKSTIIKI